jgi:probable phosphoglycerate mutase
MELILVRHGLPDFAPEKFYRNDPHLSELGHRQAALLAAKAPEWGPVDELWVSPMKRALETALPIAEAIGVAAETHEWAHEIRNPDEWEERTLDDVGVAWVEGNRRPIAEIWEGMPGGERFTDFHERVVNGLVSTLKMRNVVEVEADLRLWQLDPSDERRIVLVAHGGTNAIVVGHLLGVAPTPWEWDRLELAHTGVARLTTIPIAHGYGFSLRQFNDLNHLERGMATR